MAARKSTRPPKQATPPGSTMDVDPEWLIEFADDEAPTAKRRPSRRPNAASAPPAAARGDRPPPLPVLCGREPVITQKPGTTMDVDPEWLEDAAPRRQLDSSDVSRARRGKKLSERPPTKTSRSGGK